MQAHCEAFGASLVNVETAEENDFLRSILRIMKCKSLLKFTVTVTVKIICLTVKMTKRPVLTTPLNGKRLEVHSCEKA